MDDFAILDYMFIIPTDLWSHGSQFEKFLADFGTVHGIEISVKEAKGNSSKRILVFRKIEELPKLDNKADSPPKASPRPQVIAPPKNWKQTSSQPILKGVIPTKTGPQPKMKNFYDQKFTPHKEKK